MWPIFPCSICIYLYQSPSNSSTGCGFWSQPFLSGTGSRVDTERRLSIKAFQLIHKKPKPLSVSSYYCLINLNCLNLRNTLISLHNFLYRLTLNGNNLPAGTHITNFKTHLNTKRKPKPRMMFHPYFIHFCLGTTRHTLWDQLQTIVSKLKATSKGKIKRYHFLFEIESCLHSRKNCGYRNNYLG